MRRIKPFNKYLKFTVYSVFLLTVTGCSALMEYGYLAPAGGDNWTRNDYSSYKHGLPSYLYTCGDKTIEVIPARFYEYVYSVGPAIFPIIPFFNAGGEPMSSFEITLRVKPCEVVPEPHNMELSMLIPGDQQKTFSGIVSVSDYIPSNTRFIKVSYSTDMTKYDDFILNFANVMKGCFISPLKFNKQFKFQMEGIP
jgi:hypothetical protein